MRGQWFIWALVAAVGIGVLVVFNYQGHQDSLSLSEIFPDHNKSAETEDVEYEFVPAPKEAVPSAVQTTDQPAVQVSEKPVERQPEATVPSVTSTKIAQPALPAPKVTPPQIKITEPVKSPPAQSVKNAPIVSTVDSHIKATDTVNAPFTIQVASLKDRQSAEVTLKGIQAAGHQGYIVVKDLGAKGIWYRIYIGKFQTKEEANKKLSEIKSSYSNSFVISP